MIFISPAFSLHFVCEVGEYISYMVYLWSELGRFGHNLRVFVYVLWYGMGCRGSLAAGFSIE